MKTKPFKILSLLIILGILFIGTSFLSTKVSASCNIGEESYPQINSINSPIGTLNNPTTLNMNASATSSFYCASVGGAGDGETGTNWFYSVLNSNGDVVYPGSSGVYAFGSGATSGPHAFTISGFIDVSSWPAGNYTATFTVGNDTSGPGYNVGGSMNSSFTITRPSPAPSGSISISTTSCVIGSTCGSVNLTWSSSNSSNSRIYLNGSTPTGWLAPSGSTAAFGISGAGNYTYCMNGKDANGTEVNMTPQACTQTLVATNPVAPTCSLDSFTSSPNSGQLNWATTNCTGVTIDNGIGSSLPASGNHSCVGGTTYVLTATNSTPSSKTALCQSPPPPPQLIVSFSSHNINLAPGQSNPDPFTYTKSGQAGTTINIIRCVALGPNGYDVSNTACSGLLD